MLIAVPTMGSVHTLLANWLVNQASQHEIIFTNQVSPHSHARNRIVELFLSSPHNELLMVDSDTIPPEGLLFGISQYDIVTGVTPILRGDESFANVYINTTDVESPLRLNELPTEPFKVVGCGASFLYIKRHVLEEMSKPWFKTIEFDNGNICSEDLYFCEQVIKNGFDIWCLPQFRCQHAKTILL